MKNNIINSPIVNIEDFTKKSIVKFYYDKGRHASTSLCLYNEKLYVHKLLGNNYQGVTEEEYFGIIDLTHELCRFLGDKTSIVLPEIAYIGYNRECNCVERIEKYCGSSLRHYFPVANENEREKIVVEILNQINSLVRANRSKEELTYSIDPTPDNFTYDGKTIFFVDFMPPLVNKKRFSPHSISDKSRSKEDLRVQNMRYFTQGGIYLTFLTKFGSVDISFFEKLFKLTMSSITNTKTKKYINNSYLRAIKSTVGKGYHYGELLNKIAKILSNISYYERDLIRLLSLFFIKDKTTIENNAAKYRIQAVKNFLLDKRSASEIIDSLIYSDFRSKEKHGEFKGLVEELIALQYAK